MKHELPELPYGKSDLEPYLSEETLEYHYGKHHAGYVKKLNKLLGDNSQYQDKSLETIIQNADGDLFNNAAQTWNHNFYWRCLTPDGSDPGKDLTQSIDKAFGSMAEFKDKFLDKAAANFGSGWTWLVKNRDGELSVVNTDDADNPLTNGDTPLLTCDVWEHAYYIDYRNKRAKYLENFWKIVNWSFVEENLASA